MAEEETKTTEVIENAEPKAVDTAVAEAPTEGAPVISPAQTSETEVSVGKPKKKKAKRNVPHAQIHILATFNNTIVTITDEKGATLASASAGASGFRGSKKGTAYAAQVAAEKATAEVRQNFGVAKADVLVKGIGLGREAAIRSLVNQKIAVESIKDVTGIPHGGVRPRKAKRN